MNARIATWALPLLACCLPAALDGCRKPPTPAAVPGANPAPWFSDITSSSGVRFIHAAGTNYFMPDQIGSGVVLFDYDGDGRVDIYLVQNGGTNRLARNQLFHQQVDGTFKDTSPGSGLDVAGRGMGAIAGDINNDGRPDVVLTEYGATRLFLNLGGGAFREITREAGIDNVRWAAPASFIDYDRDGWLDLVVGNYVDYDPTHVCADVHGQPDFCAPKSFASTTARLWHNVTASSGAPRFEERTEQSGLSRSLGACLGLVCADFDGDGWPDIFCADDGLPNRLFINRRNGTFSEEAASRGLAFNGMGAAAANMGTAFADVDGDGLGDLFVTHLTEEFHSLFKQGPRGIFSDVIAPSGLQQQAWRGTGFGTVLTDFNNDGTPDLVFGNGLVRRITPGHTPVAPGVDPWWGRYAQKSQVFENRGAGKFRDISTENPALTANALVARSVAVADLDRDGGMDLLVGNVGGPVRVLRNVASRGHWIQLKLILPRQGGRDAIGAEATVRASGRTLWAVLQPATSYFASNEPTLHFGLGDAGRYESVDVLWPDGGREHVAGGSADRLVVIRKTE